MLPFFTVGVDLSIVEHLVYQAIAHGLLRIHEIIALGVTCYFVNRLTRMFRQYLI
jgi:hypothetical protein